MGLPAKRNAQLPTTGTYTQDQIDLIKRTVAKDTTDDELKLFLYQAQRTGLDPLAKQIYCIKRWDNSQSKKVMSIGTSIDGFRLIAERSKKYAGQSGPQWCADDGHWLDVWTKKEPPAAARVGVLRSDFKQTCWGVASYNSYVQKTRDGTPNTTWRNMPDVMIAKCAEALGLRKAFPQELGGVYTPDELAAGMTDDIPADDPVELVSPAQLDEIIRIADELGADKRMLVEHLSRRWEMDIPALAAIPAEYYQDTLAQLELKRSAVEKSDQQGDAGHA